MSDTSIAGGPITAAKLNEVQLGSGAPTYPSPGWLWVDPLYAQLPQPKVFDGTNWNLIGDQGLTSGNVGCDLRLLADSNGTVTDSANTANHVALTLSGFSITATMTIRLVCPISGLQSGSAIGLRLNSTIINDTTKITTPYTAYCNGTSVVGTAFILDLTIGAAGGVSNGSGAPGQLTGFPAYPWTSMDITCLSGASPVTFYSARLYEVCPQGT